MPDIYRVTLPEAAKRLSVPIGTLYSWASRGSITPMAIESDGTKWYSLHAIEAVYAARKQPRGKARRA